MSGIIAAVIATGIVTTTAGAIFVIASVVITLASVGMMAYQIASMPDTGSNELKGRQQTVRSAVSPHRIIYGEVVAGGTLVYTQTIDGPHTSNLFCYLVIALTGHEVDSIGDVWLGDKLSTDPVFSGSHYTVPFFVPVGGVATISDPAIMSSVPSSIVVTNTFTGAVISPSLYTVDRMAQRITCDASLAGQYLSVGFNTSYVQVSKHLGTETQEADAELVAVSRGLWTANHRLRGIAYVVVRLQYELSAFPTGLPNIKCRIKGRKVYDPRTGTTAWSDNWALCVLDYLTAGFGLGCDLSTEIDASGSFIGAANISDETVQIHVGTGAGYTTDGAAYAAGATLLKLVGGTGTILAGDQVTIAGNTYRVKYSLGSFGNLTLDTGLTADIASGAHTAVAVVPTNTEKRYACNGSFTLDQRPVDIMQKMLSAGIGKLVYQQGKYIIKAGAYSSPVGTLTEDDLRGKIAVQTKQSKQSRFNGVKGTFSDPLKNWQPADFPLVTNPLYVTEDAGEEINKDIELSFTTSSHAAQRISKIILEKNRQGITVKFPAKFTAFQYAVGDVLQVSIKQLGWVNKEFEVLNWELAKDGAGVDLTLQEESAGCYDWNYGEATAVDPAPDTQLPNPWVVGPPSGLAVVEELYYGNSRGDIKTRGIVSWTANDASGHRFRVQLNGVAAGETTDTQWVFNDLSTQLYTFGVAAVNALDVTSEYTTLAYRVLGKTAPPPAVSAFLVERQPDGTRQFTWAIDAPLDLAGFRIRYVSGTDGEWSTMTPLHDGLLTSSPYETNQLPAGDYVFAIVSEDTSGNISPAVYIETTLEDPRLADVILDRYPHRDAWPGTLTNCYRDERGYLVAKDQKTWADFATDGVTWAGWTQWARDPYDTITYTDEVIDLGVSAPFTPVVSALADGTVAVEMQTSDDNVSWSSWGATVFVTKRYVQFRITITNATGLAVLKAVTIYLSGRPVVTELNDLATSSLSGSYRIGTGDIRLPVAGRYAKINTVLITLQNVGAGWSYELVDKASTYGPRIKIYNASNVLADATIDAYVKGV